MSEFKTLAAGFAKKWPDSLPQRVRDLDALDRVRNGTIYDMLPYPFEQEYDDTDNYIPIGQRRPSARYRMAKVVVDETASLTFGEGHSPYIKVYDPFTSVADDDQDKDEDKTRKLTRIIEFLRYVLRMDAVMFECIQKGSSGSVCAIAKVTSDGRPWVRVVRGADLHPRFDPNDPDKLVELSEIYRTTLKDLLDFGYTRAELGYSELDEPSLDTEYWVNHHLDDQREQWMKPLTRAEMNRLGKKKDDGTNARYKWEEDPSRVYPHKWQCVPAIWGRNLHEREEIDGPSTYEAIVDNCIELDYLISQIGRGFKYSMDPLLAIKSGAVQTRIPVTGVDDPETGLPNIDRTPARVVQIPEGGDAKMLEIAGMGLTAAKDWTKLLREWSMEVVGGMKSDQEHAGGPQSGRALELLHQALVWLVGRMRLDYGDGLMIPLIKLFLKGVTLGFVQLWGVKPTDVPKEDYPLRNVWPSWWQPRGADLYQTAQALLLGAGGSSREGKQMLPMRFVFEAFAAALGHPDPSAIAEQAEVEFEKFRQEQLEILKPKPAAGPGAPGGNASGGSGT
jgi:hypothetical protein